MMAPGHFKESIQGLGHLPAPIFSLIGNVSCSTSHQKRRCKICIILLRNPWKGTWKVPHIQVLNGAYSQPLQMKI